MKYEFIEDLDDEEVQPIEVREQGDFLALIQWDGTGEFQHHVLIPKSELPEYLTHMYEVAK